MQWSELSLLPAGCWQLAARGRISQHQQEKHFCWSFSTFMVWFRWYHWCLAACLAVSKKVTSSHSVCYEASLDNAVCCIRRCLFTQGGFSCYYLMTPHSFQQLVACIRLPTAVELWIFAKYSFVYFIIGTFAYHIIVWTLQNLTWWWSTSSWHTDHVYRGPSKYQLKSVRNEIPKLDASTLVGRHSVIQRTWVWHARQCRSEVYNHDVETHAILVL